MEGAHGGCGPLPAALVGIVSGALGLINLIPRRRGLFLSDGGWLVEWILRPDAAASLVAIALIHDQATLGTRLRDVPEVWFQIALRAPYPELTWEATGVAYNRALEYGRIDEAERHLQRALELPTFDGAPPLARTVLRLEAAFFYLRYRGDPATAAALFPAAEELDGVPGKARLPAEAAMALARGNTEAAAAAAERYLASPFPPHLPAALIAVEREEMERIRDEARRTTPGDFPEPQVSFVLTFLLCPTCCVRPAEAGRRGPAQRRMDQRGGRQLVVFAALAATVPVIAIPSDQPRRTAA